MGVPSIVPLIKHNPSLFARIELHDCKLVIDGNSLENYIYNNTNIDKDHGGDYNAYSSNVETLFGIFSKFSIIPIVVFDGGYELDDRKKDTLLKRAQNRINDPKMFAPLLIHETFVSTLDRLTIKHVTCDFEADPEMVVLANQLKCPVLSFDSDFFIFEIEEGYISIEDLNIKSLLEGGKTEKIEVAIYKTKDLEKRFPFLEGKLGLLASALGNDYIPKDSKAIQDFYKMLKLPKPDQQIFEALNPPFCAIIRKVLFWLEENDLSYGTKQLTKFMNSKEKELVQMSMKTYSNSTEYSTFDLLAFLKNPLSNTCSSGGILEDVNPWIRLNHRSGKLPNFIQNTLLNRRNVLLCQVEDMSKESAHNCSMSIRQAIYGILFGTKTPVEEYDRKGKELVCKTVFGISVSTYKQGVLVDIKHILELADEEKVEILRKILNDSIPATRMTRTNSGTDIFKMIFMYWLKRSDFSLESNLVYSILISFVLLSIRKRRNTDLESVGVIDMWLEPSGDSYTNENMPDSIALAQLQSCFKFGMYLNRLLGSPVENIDPSTLYSGSIIREIYYRLQQQGFDNVYKRLRKIPTAIDNFDDILAFVRSNVSN